MQILDSLYTRRLQGKAYSISFLDQLISPLAKACTPFSFHRNPIVMGQNANAWMAPKKVLNLTSDGIYYASECCKSRHPGKVQDLLRGTCT